MGRMVQHHFVGSALVAAVWSGVNGLFHALIPLHLSFLSHFQLIPTIRVEVDVDARLLILLLLIIFLLVELRRSLLEEWDRLRY